MPRAVQYTAQTTFIVACFRSSYHVSVSHVVPVVHRAKSGLIYSLSRISPLPSPTPAACWDEVEGYPPISLIQTRGIPPSSGLTESGNRPGANLSIPNNSTPVCPTARKPNSSTLHEGASESAHTIADNSRRYIAKRKQNFRWPSIPRRRASAVANTRRLR